MSEWAISYVPIENDDDQFQGVCFRVADTTTVTTLLEPVQFPARKPLFEGDTLFHLVPTEPYDYEQWHLFDVQAMYLSSKCALTYYIYMFSKVLEHSDTKSKHQHGLLWFIMHLLHVHRYVEKYKRRVFF